MDYVYVMGKVFHQSDKSMAHLHLFFVELVVFV
jgi:hypothetical protein